MKGLITAIRTLTILPLPFKGSSIFSTALYWFVWVGAMLGGIVYLMVLGISQIDRFNWHQGTAVLVIGLGIFLTRGFHLDGLADFADAFWGAYDREKTLAIMKDSFLGTFGVIALIVILFAKWVAIVRLLELNAGIWIMGAYIVSRFLMVEMIVCFPYARESGTAGPFFVGSGFRHRLVAFLSATLMLFFLFSYQGLILLIIGWIFCRLLGLWCLKRVGGITGDILGTCGEVSETLVLISAVYLCNG